MTKAALHDTSYSHSMIDDLGQDARHAAQQLVSVPTETINAALHDLAERLNASTEALIAANQKDLEQAAQKELSGAMIDRLTLTPERIESISQSVLDIAALEDPCGTVMEETTRPNGLVIQKIAVPIGVLGMIYESRPNVTIDAAVLCLKSHNAVILRGGSESFHSARFLHGLIQEALEAHTLPPQSVAFVNTADRQAVSDMLAAHNYIDVMIPRGGAGLTQRVMSEAKMPVFAHLDGNCHIYVHRSAKPEQAVEVIRNAKLRRTGICGAAESLLFDEKLDDATAQEILKMLLEEGCTIYGDDRASAFDLRIEKASEEDWRTEYLDTKISCKYVEDVRAAIHHINHYGSHHTDAILAEDTDALSLFAQGVDSAIIMQNTSTQFADGGEFGMGAEIGIGTGKLHARGPVGLKQLTTFKYVVTGTGQTRA